MIPTPAQASDLIEHFGGQRAAARALGVSPNTIAYWLRPEYRAASSRRGTLWHREQYRNDPEFRARSLADDRRRYHAETGLQRAQRQLRMRRTKALIRRAERDQRS